MCPRGRPRGQGRPRGLHLCCVEQQSFIILNSCNFANTKKSLKFYRFESVQILVSLISLNFFFVFCLFLVYFAAKDGIVFNFFLNLEQK